MKLSKKIIIIAVVLAVITTGVVYYYLHSIKSTESATYYADVLVAKADIAPKTKIDKTMVDMERVDSRSMAPNAATNSGTIIGKYTTQTVIKGEQITSDKIVDLEKGRVSYQIPKGTRAMTIAVDDIEGVANLIKPGDYVDVLLYLAKQEVQEQSDMVSYPDIVKVITQRTLVIAVNSDSGVTENQEEQNTDNKSQEKQPAKRRITLALYPDDTERLVWADELGEIRLALRHPEDDETQDTIGAIRSDVVPDKGKIILPK